jgi:PHP family Zn ribbon phosphoesterase
MCADCALTLEWETDIKEGISRRGKKSEVKMGLDPIEAWNRRAGCEHCGIWQESDRIGALPNCNDCGNRDTCEYVPKPGEIARINCPLWRAKQENNEEEPVHV